MRKACVIGYPVSHSLSPKLHRYWLKRYTMMGEYTAIEVSPETLLEFTSSLASKGFVGCNVTLPHKETIAKLMDELDAPARAIGAVNMVTVTKEGGLKGANTDAYGFIENITSHYPLTNLGKAVVLGAGGAARAVVWALKEAGFSEIAIVNRTPDKAEALKALATHRITAHAWEAGPAVLEDAALLVNTTSLGLKGQPPLELDFSMLPADAIVNDIVYTPLETAFLACARRQGYRVVDGLGMLLWQAVPAFEAWFGKRPEVTAELREYMLAC